MGVNISEVSVKEEKGKADGNYPILLVEDERITRIIIEKHLHKAGYEVVTAADGREAWNILQNRFIPIILTDWVMPEMDGLELTQKIRNTEFSGYIFIILLTALDTKEDIIKGLEAGADEYLTKPFDGTELVARLNTATRILDLEQSLKKAYDEIITDSLTDAYNRGFFSKQIPKEIQRATRYKHPFSLVLCDIDFFKQVNDTHGHQAGDLVLKSFVECIKELIRSNVDLIVRYGGEEFALILPETGLESALNLTERIRQEIADNVFIANGNKIRFTASFGVSTYDPNLTEIEATTDLMVHLADKLLYMCKNEGRNKVKGAELKQIT